MHHASRLARLRESLRNPLLVTNPVNVRYLTGFAGSNAQLVVGSDEVVFLTDGRYGEAAAGLIAALPDTTLVVYRDKMIEHVVEAAGAPATLEVEAGHLTWSAARELGEQAGFEIAPAGRAVEELRATKDDGEVDALRRAARAGDDAFARLDELLGGAATEADLAWGLIGAMRRSGAAMASWEPIVAAGPNAALPHHRAGATALSGGLLLLDYGCVVDGYHSDMSRTVWHAAPLDPELAGVYRAVAEAQAAGVAAVAPGVAAAAVDAVCREVLERHGLDEYFVHSTGHGVGLEIHEAPRLGRDSKDVLAPGQVVTIEPGVYLPGRGGVRIEDMVLVTDDGGEVLTHSPRDFQGGSR